MIRLAVNPDVSSALLHDPVNGRQAKAGSFAFLFGRKERFEDLLPHVFVHAGAGVADRQHNVGAGKNTDMRARIFPVQLSVRSFDRQFAALRHRISGVDDQVNQHLLNLAGICFDALQIGRQFRAELNIFANQSLQHLVHVGDYVVQTERQRLQNLLASKGQQLPRQVRRAIAGLLDFFEVSPDRSITFDSLQRETAVTVDRGEQIVEVVSDAPRQLPDPFQLLRLSQLVLKVLPVGNVTRNALHPDGHAIKQDKFGVDLHSDPLAILGQEFHFICCANVAREFLREHLFCALYAFRPAGAIVSVNFNDRHSSCVYPVICSPARFTEVYLPSKSCE